MQGRSNYFGFKIIAMMAMVLILARAAAHEGGYEGAYDYDYVDPVDTPDNPTPTPDSNKNKATPKLPPRIQGEDSLRFPIQDQPGIPSGIYRPMDLRNPSNIRDSFTYDPDSNRYYLEQRIGNDYYHNPTYLTFDEYQKYSAQQDEQAYWRRRLDALTLFNKKPVLPVMYKEGIFDRIFGSNTIQVRPQGNVDVTLGYNYQNIKNPALVARAQRYGIFDFDLQMNVNLLATVGDKLKLNISNNTKATFDYQNQQKLEYTGREDDIIKKIEAGNISFPLKSTLVPGVQSIFGLKTQLQFGKLWVTSVVSQQKSKRQSLTVQGGAQTQQFAIKADDYEENKHFLLGQYFRSRFNVALQNFPVVNSLVTMNKIEVWITNRTGAVDGVRDLVVLQDLGEKSPYNQAFINAGANAQGLPDNRVNTLYDQLIQNPIGRQAGNATSAAIGIGLTQGQDFERTTARKLQPSEYTFNQQLGYVSLNVQTNPDDILAVAYRYSYNGKVFQVGEFSEDLPPDSTNQRVMFLKLLKGTSPRPNMPVWDLMMKNVYALGGLGVSKEDFRLNILYQDPGGGEKRYLPETNIPNPGTPLLTLLNLDRLNFQNDPSPDGVFDYIEGITINSQQGKIIFPVLEPFGSDLAPKLGNNAQIERRYLYQILYDSTKTVARQFQQNNRFIMRGTYRSASSSEIFLGGFNIPQGSVAVSAGGQRLTENSDYQIDYSLGRVKILNQGVLNSGIPINISYEDNATFGFQQQNFMGSRFDYFANDKLTVGGTIMRLTERPFTQKTNFGEDPIKNTVISVDGAYQSEAPGLTRLIDKLPIYSTTAPSFITAAVEGATIRPGHSKLINALDPEGSVYVDDFEGTRSSYDLKFPATSWSLASTPVGATNAAGNILFPEANDNNKLSYGRNRARLAWYFIEPTLVDGTGGLPDYIKNDPNQHYIRQVQAQEVYPQRSTQTLQNAISTLDLAFYPNQRGPYNFDGTRIAADGKLLDPRSRWGGIQRPIDYSDFEQANVEFIELWVMDPFINRTNNPSGSLYINLGNVSEDVLKDSRKFFENGIQHPKNPASLDQSVWGYIPRFQQQITRAFDNDPDARATQDVGFDGLNDGEEATNFQAYLTQLQGTLGGSSPAYLAAAADPSSDNYRWFNDPAYSGTPIMERYKAYNNPQGNSPAVAASGSNVSNSQTNIPESEDINRDNTLNENEQYFQYRIDFTPNMQIGAANSYVVNKQISNVKLPNGTTEAETWYQMKIPIREFTNKVGGIADFRSIRFMRMFMAGFEDSTVMRFASINLGRNQWRRYFFSLQSPGENIPDDSTGTDFAVTSVSIEENSGRDPIPYVIPPGVDRQQQAVSNGQNIQLNEQSLSLQVCGTGGLKDGDARAAFKEVNVDMRQFGNLRMFIHAEGMVGSGTLNNGDVRAIIRIGSDFISNYYEYQIPLDATPFGTRDKSGIWPERNFLDLALDRLVQAKTTRNALGRPAFVPYSELDDKGNTIVVVGNPNVGDAKTILLGILNPKKTTQTPQDDGLPKCAEVWFNELRMTGLNETPGYAATGKVNIQLADLGNIAASGAMHTQGYGNIDQKLLQRRRDNYHSYDAATNLQLGKLLPRKWGVQLPLYVGHAATVSNPQYNPYDLDVTYRDQLDAARDAQQRDSLKKVAQDYTAITSFNLANVRILGNPDKQNAKTMPWSVKNFDLSYAYNKQFKRNPLIESDELVNQRLGLGYTYAIRNKSIEPFKKAIKSKSKWWNPIKDFNFNPLPSSFTFRTDLNRIFDETQVRNVGDGPFKIAPTYYKNFLWQRTYTLVWELTKSLSFNYQATNNSRVDEPYGRITGDNRDSFYRAVGTLGRNTLYTQRFDATYNVPLAKLPLTDWTNLRATYGATYGYTAASVLAKNLGNAVANTQTKQINGDLNFSQLYNKNRYLRAINTPKKKPQNSGNNPSKSGDGKAGPGSDRNPVNARDPRDPRSGRDQRVGGDKGPDGRNEPGADNSPAPDKGNDKNDPKPEDTTQTTKPVKDPFTLNGKVINVAGMSDQQVDSVRKLIREADRQKAAAEKAKRKADRKAARKKRRATTPEISNGVRFAGRLATMLKRVTVSYQETAGTVLPGLLDSAQIMGVNTTSLQPGLAYVYGYQPGRSWLSDKANDGRLSTDTLFNAQFQQNFAQNLNITGLLEPFPDFRIDLNLTKSFSKTYQELYKDTLNGFGDFQHLAPYAAGSFNITTIGIKEMFGAGGASSDVYRKFIDGGITVSNRLGEANTYTRGQRDPNDARYAKGYTKFSQEVLVPAFIAAYTGKSAGDVPTADFSDRSTRHNPYKGFTPLPNWKLTYNGLGKLPMFKEIVQNIVISHGYTATMGLNSFNSSLLYQDIYSLGFPSFIDSNSGNFIPYFQVPNITISQQLGPLIGVDASFNSGLTTKIGFNKSRNVSLSLIDYQISETRSQELVIGAGYRIPKFTIPLALFGLNKLKTPLNLRADVGIRDDKAFNTYISQNLDVITRGAKVITVSPSADYLVSDKLTLRFFFDYRKSIPYTTQAFPTTTIRGGLTLRFIFAPQ